MHGSMIVSFGELLVDMIREGDFYKPYPGGAPANFAVAVSRLGRKPRLISSVGRDAFGDFLLRCMKSEGINTSFVKRSEKKTTLAFVELRQGVPSFSFYRGADTDISPGEIRPAMLAGAEHLHCGGFSLSCPPARDALFTILQMARERGIGVSFSPNTRPDIWRAELNRHLHRALGFADTVIASRGEFRLLASGSAPGAIMKRHGIRRLIITAGPKGSVIYTGSGRKAVPAFRVRAVDSTGSGDAFAGAVACGICGGMEDSGMMRFASAAAALSVTKKGAMSALPSRGEVEEFLKDRKAT